MRQDGWVGNWMGRGVRVGWACGVWAWFRIRAKTARLSRRLALVLAAGVHEG